VATIVPWVTITRMLYMHDEIPGWLVATTRKTMRHTKGYDATPGAGLPLCRGGYRLAGQDQPAFLFV